MLCPMFAWQGYLLNVLLRDFRWLATPDNFVNHLLFRKLSYKMALKLFKTQRETRQSSFPVNYFILDLFAQLSCI